MKFKCKILPVSLYDVVGLEAWLNEQGANGLFPKVVRDSYARFYKQDVPSGARFRLTAMDKLREPGEDLLQLYEESGWSYLLSISNLWYLFWSPDPQAAEPYTDSITRGHNINTLTKRIHRGLISYVVIALPLILLLAYLGASLSTGLPSFSKFDVQPVSPRTVVPLLMVNASGVILVGLICFFIVFFFDLSNSIALLRLRSQLMEGMNQAAFASPRYRRRNLVRSCCTNLFLLFSLVCMLWRYPFPLEKAPFPYLPLEELEATSVGNYEALLGPSGRSSGGDTMGSDFVLLSPIYYTTTQDSYGLPPDGYEDWEFLAMYDGKDIYHASLDATYFHLLIPPMARSVAESTLNNLRLVNLYWSYEERSYPGTDFIILASEPDGFWQMAAVANGGKLVVLRYSGIEDFADHLDQLAALVA